MKIPSKKNEQQSQDSADQKMKRLGRKSYFAPSKRGYKVPGGGYSNYIDLPSEYRGSSRQVCGLWPFSSGAGSPLDGVPWGKNLLTNSAVGFDHFTAYERGIISQPSLYMESFPALGKSTLVGKICMGLDYYGVKNMVLGDVKGEHVARTVAMGGKRIPLGNGRGYLNPMDYGVAEDAIKRLSGSLREEVLVEAHDHSKALLIALMTIARREAPSEEEEIVIDVGMRLLRERFDGVPLIGDLSQLIAEKPEALRNAVLDRGDDARYADSTDALRKTLNGLMSGGPLGTMFSRHTAEADRFDLTRSCVFDLSAISDTLPAQQAAGMLASWSTGFASVKVAHILADAGLEPRRNYNVVLDELWRALRIGRGIVDRADSLTRLNRHQGIGQMMISHTLKDFDAVTDEADRKKAQGFASRCAVMVMGGLDKEELDKVHEIRSLTREERKHLMSWGDAKKITTQRRGNQAPFGRGKFLLKLGNSPGIPVQTRLTEIEQKFADTNQRWDKLRQSGVDAADIEAQIFGGSRESA